MADQPEPAGRAGQGPHQGRPAAAELAEIDPEWNPRELGWTVDWQRHYVKVRTCLEAGASIEELAPGVRLGGEDVGRRLKRQQEDWDGLNAEQQRRCRKVGRHGRRTARRWAHSAAGGGARAAAFERGLAAARQYRDREGTLEAVGRKHVETIV